MEDSFFFCSLECAQLFHKAGARLILCGTNWDKLESLYESLTNDADPSEVRKGIITIMLNIFLFGVIFFDQPHGNNLPQSKRLVSKRTKHLQNSLLAISVDANCCYCH